VGEPECDPPKRKPTPLGYMKQVDAISTVASPLLAGFSLASVIIVSGDAKNFRWPGAAMLALTIAAIMLFVALQCGLMARLYQPDVQEGPERQRLLHMERAKEFRPWWDWTVGARVAHYCGIVTLLLGLSLALPPQPDNGGQGSLRWAASGVAFAACLGEFTWIIMTRYPWLTRYLRRQHQNTNP
jgi:hypothetical protein